MQFSQNPAGPPPAPPPGWAPAGVGPHHMPPASRKRMPWWGWLLIGCGGLLLLGIIGMGACSVALFRQFSVGGSCMPADFPRYPQGTAFGVRAKVASERGACFTVYTISAPAADVASFYDRSLGEGDWEITREARNGAFLAFQRSGDARVHGTVDVVMQGDHTQVTAALYS